MNARSNLAGNPSLGRYYCDQDLWRSNKNCL